MFNKPNLFHKTAETPAQRTSRSPNSLASGASTSAAADAAGAAVTSSASAAAAQQQAAGEQRTAVAEREQTKSETHSSESRLIVGPDVKLKGAEIQDCDTLVVEGLVEATMDSRVLRIAEKGAYKGTVGIDIAEIHGSFEGELTAREQLLIHSGGRVSGKIRYGKILIEEGGEISGDVRSLSDVGKNGQSTVERHHAVRPLSVAAG